MDISLQQSPPPSRVVRIVVTDIATKKLLLVQSADRPNMWELPGGKAKTHETALAAALRELKEETALMPATLHERHSFARQAKYAGAKRYEHIIFSCSYPHTPTVFIDHYEVMDYRWLSLRDALSYEVHLEWLSKYYLSKIRAPAATPQ